jgi:ESCRT-II complex subunit VPS36
MLYVTSHRLILIENQTAIQIPLHYITNPRTSGGVLRSHKVKVDIHNRASLPFYTEEQCRLQNQAPPAPPTLPQEVIFKFRSGGKGSVWSAIQESLNREAWKQPIKVERPKLQGYGIQGLKKTMQEENKAAEQAVSNSFTDLHSLSQKSRELISLATRLKSVEESKDEEMQEIFGMMSELGMTSGVTRETAGKQYYQQLARELVDCIRGSLEKSGGLMLLLDVFCIYNRARGSDLASPSDMLTACKYLDSLSIRVRDLPGGIKAIQSDSMVKKLYSQVLDLVRSEEHLSAQALANKLSLNPLIAKECLLELESQGLLCRDQTIYGLHFYYNILR